MGTDVGGGDNDWKGAIGAILIVVASGAILLLSIWVAIEIWNAWVAWLQ